MSVFDEENTLAPEVMDGHLNSILKGTEKYLNLFPSLWRQEGSQLLSPGGGKGSKLILPPLLQGWVLQSQSKYRSRSQGRVGFLHEEGSKKEGIPSSSLDTGDIRTVLGLLSLAKRDQADTLTATDSY